MTRREKWLCVKALEVYHDTIKPRFYKDDRDDERRECGVLLNRLRRELDLEQPAR